MLFSAMSSFSLSLWTCNLLHFCHACLSLICCELAVAQVFIFCQASPEITAMCFIAMLGCCSIVACCILSAILLLSPLSVILVLLAICKPCIRFRWSLYRFRPKSSHLSSGMLGLPSYCLVHHFPSGARICIAYHILHIIHVLHHVACAFLVVDCGSVCLCSCLG